MRMQRVGRSFLIAGLAAGWTGDFLLLGKFRIDARKSMRALALEYVNLP